MSLTDNVEKKIDCNEAHEMDVDNNVETMDEQEDAKAEDNVIRNTLVAFNAQCYDWSYKLSDEELSYEQRDKILNTVFIKGHTEFAKRLIRIRKGKMENLGPKIAHKNEKKKIIGTYPLFNESDENLGQKTFYLVEFFVDHKNRKNEKFDYETNFQVDAECFGFDLKRSYLIIRQDAFSKELEKHYAQKKYLSHAFEFISYPDKDKHDEVYKECGGFLQRFDNTKVEFLDYDACKVLDGTYDYSSLYVRKEEQKKLNGKEATFLSWVAAYLLKVTYAEHIKSFSNILNVKLKEITCSDVTGCIAGSGECKSCDSIKKSVDEIADQAKMINNLVNEITTKYNFYLAKYYRALPIEAITAKNIVKVNDRAQEYFRVEEYKEELSSELLNLHSITEVIRKHAEIEAQSKRDEAEKENQEKSNRKMNFLAFVGVVIAVLQVYVAVRYS